MVQSYPVQNVLPQFDGENYQRLAVMPLKLPNVKLSVAVGYRQLMTMASEMEKVDPTGWSLLYTPLSSAVSPSATCTV